MNILEKLKDKFFLSIAFLALCCFAGGYLLGCQKEPIVQVVEKKIEDIETNQKLIEAQKTVSSLQEQLTITQNQVIDMKNHVKTVVRIVKQKDGTVIIDKVTESDTSKHVEEKTNTSSTTNNTVVSANDKVVDTKTKVHTENTTITKPMIKDMYYLGLSSRVGITGISDPGLEFKYRVLDFGRLSGWAGVEIIVPAPVFKVENIQGRVSLGVSF
jgi:hypothetical protein